MRPLLAMRAARRRWGLCMLVQIHHIIPRQWAQHPTVVASAYDIHHGANLMFMPTDLGVERLRLRPERMRFIHSASHPKYNLYVKARLDALDDDAQSVLRLADELRLQLRRGDPELPWR